LKIGAACAAIGNNIYSFGGKDNKDKLDNRLSVLNVN
jgi:hypothetical protein